MQYLSVVVLGLACLVVVLLVIGKIKQRNAQKNILKDCPPPTLGPMELDDGIIAVRKKEKPTDDSFKEESKITSSKSDEKTNETAEMHGIIVLYVMAKVGKAFAGYELLQALLSSGLRFGEMSIFHYYRDANAEQDPLFSLASATEPGIFDLLNMGAFSSKGLTLFLKKTENEEDNTTRYELMLETARHLSEDLHGVLLDGHKQLIPALIPSAS